MRVVFLNRFYFPDHSATSQMLTGLATDLARRGADVHVIASRQRYDDARADLAGTEMIDGVHVRRVSTTRFGRAGLAGRSIDYASSYAAMWRAALQVATPGTIVVAKTDPPMLSILAARAARRRRAHLVNWLQDLYPEVAAAAGMRFAQGRAGQILTSLRDASLRAASANVVVGERMAANVRARGVAGDRVHTIPNWADDTAIRPLPIADNPLRHELGLADRFVVGYSGNLGRAHEFDTLLGAAERLRDDRRVVFLTIGGGALFDRLAREAHARGLAELFRFLPYQSQERLAPALAAADVHWLSLLPAFEGLIVPSKFYGIAAAGRAIIAIAEPEGDIGTLVRQHACGIAVAPGDSSSLAAELRGLMADRSRVETLGRNARAMLDQHFSRQKSLQRWHDLLTHIGTGPLP
jgi:glycosyltransferase involved in cell wall biosynthesis